MNYSTQYYIDRQKTFLDQVQHLQSCLEEKRSLEYQIENLLEEIKFNRMILRANLNNFIAKQKTDSAPAPKK